MKLRLTPVDEKHLRWIREQRNRRELQDFCRQPFMLNEINQEDWLKQVSRDRSMIPFIVQDDDLKQGENWVGYAAFSHIDWVSRRAEISYFTALELAGKGYAFLAIPMVLEYGFRRLGLNKICTDTFAFNARELEIMKLVGFKEEGRLERHYFKRGKFQDSVQIAIFADEFKTPEEVLASETECKPL